MAGHQGERIAFPHSETLDWATDLALARLYASTICAPDAIAAYLHFAAQEAKAILERYWFIVQALAEALEARQTLDGTEIDTIIATAIGEATLAKERARRQRMREAAERAAIFREKWGIDVAITRSACIPPTGTPR